jgi:transcription elongation factor GreA
MDEVHLSADAHQRLSEELEYRSGPRRREISEWIERAREHGDIRENADFDAAKNEQGHNEGRVRHLTQMLRTAVIVESSSADIVAPGKIVEIRMDDDDETMQYLVGSIEERHDVYDVISASSPLGKVLVGHAPGDVVEFEGPKKTFSVEVVGVRDVGD